MAGEREKRCSLLKIGGGFKGSRKAATLVLVRVTWMMLYDIGFRHVWEKVWTSDHGSAISSFKIPGGGSPKPKHEGRNG